MTTCLDCQRCKRPAHVNKTPIGALAVPQPCTRWNVDFHGPFPSSAGKRYILVFMCMTSGWPEVVATDDTKGSTIVQALYDSIVTRFGTPRGLTLQSDNGSGFVSEFTRLCCQTLNIRQSFTAPFNAQANSKVESWATIIHQSLRLLCKTQTEWSKHLQTIAWAYRASATTNLVLSPFEVLFGRLMELPIDITTQPEKLIGSNEAYFEEIGPKLELLHQIARLNAIDNAARQRFRLNKDAVIPNFKPVDKVLLYDPTTKKNENAKLKVRYHGPYVIQETCPGYTFILQEQSTGKILKRRVHARRLRPLKERKPEFFGDEMISNKPSTWTIDGELEVRVVLQDITTTKVNAALCYIDGQLEPLGEVSNRLMEAGGSDLTAALNEIVGLNTCLGIPPIMSTIAGELQSVGTLLFAVLNKEELNEADLQSKLSQALTSAEEDVKSIAIAFPDIMGFNHSVWSLSQMCVDSIVDYRKAMKSNSLLRIDFVILFCRRMCCALYAII